MARIIKDIDDKVNLNQAETQENITGKQQQKI
jgi:hypothetical protein